MGLAEKRAVKEFQENVFPGLHKALNEAAGFEVNVEVDWDTIAEDGMSHLYESAWSKVFFNPVVEGLKSICSDDMGKEALQSTFKKLHLTNQAGVYGEQAVSFADGVLKIDHQPFSNIDDEKLRTKAVVSVLENGL